MAQAPDIFSSARSLLEMLSGGDISAAELLEAHAARFEKVNPAINAVVRDDLTAARARA